MLYRNEGEDGALLLRVGVELNYLTPDDVKQVYLRQTELRQGGIDIGIGQTMLERRFVRSNEYRRIAIEVEKQRALRKPTQPVVPIKKTFGQYELLQSLSEHGHCRVMKARDTLLDRIVVLKVLPSSLARDSQWSERFKREVQLAGKLSHPNIVMTYGAGEIDGNPLMVIEWVEGLSLGEKLERDGCLSEKDAWTIAREVANGLAFAGKHGILHRDIKPDNILCGKDGSVKIIDMGLGKSVTDNSGLTAEGTTVGTPFYISPEQSRSTKDLDARADIYSLGCTVFHALTGIVPFLGDQVMDVMVKHIHAPRPDPREFMPSLLEPSARLVMRMMAVNAADRPADAEMLVAEIDSVLQAISIAPPPPAPPTRRPMVAPPPSRPITNRPMVPPPPTNRPTVPPPPTNRPLVPPPPTNRPTVPPPPTNRPMVPALTQKTNRPMVAPPNSASASRMAPGTRTPNVSGSRTPQPNRVHKPGSVLNRITIWFRRLFQ